MSIRRRFARLFGPDPARDVDDELSFHAEMRLRERLAAGADPVEAQEQVLARLGDVAAARAECVTISERRGRRMRRMDYLSELRQDVAYAIRSLRRTPGFAAVAIMTLALGIGANSAIFSVVYGVLLEPLPYAQARELVFVETEYTDGGTYPLSAGDFVSVRDENRVFSDVGAVTWQDLILTERGAPRELEGALVSRELFGTLGLTPVAGRAFTPEEHVPGAGDVAVLTQAMAEREFGGTNESLNQSLMLNGRSFTVVGVMPAGTETPETAELYLPLPYDSSFSAGTAFARRSEFLSVVGRLRPGATRVTALADMRRLGESLEERFPGTNTNITLTAQPLADTVVGDVRAPLLILLGAVCAVLLVACANVANLLLARATVRESELAVRSALGAGRGRLLRQLLTESAVLALTGATVGLALAWWGTRALVAAQPADIPRLRSIGVDGTVIAFTFGVAVLTGLLFGAMPALQATGVRMIGSLREGGRGALSGVRGQAMRSTLVISELALAVMLLVGAGLLMRSFLGMMRVDVGFKPDNIAYFRLSTQGTAYGESEQVRMFYEQLQDRLRALPGVDAVGMSSGLPMTDNVALLGPFQVEGREVPAGVLPEIRVLTTSPAYFDVIGVPLLRGRWLDERDNAGAPLTVLVNRAAVDVWFPDGDPVGERILLGGNPREVVGVVDDVLQGPPGSEAEPEMYVTHAQRTNRTMRIVVKSRAGLPVLADQIRGVVGSLDASLPVNEIAPLEDVISDAVARPRLYTMLLTVFAAVAFSLAVIGIFGVMSYVVAQRAREISIRMALGADRASVVAMVVARCHEGRGGRSPARIRGRPWRGSLHSQSAVRRRSRRSRNARRRAAAPHDCSACRQPGPRAPCCARGTRQRAAVMNSFASAR